MISGTDGHKLEITCFQIPSALGHNLRVLTALVLAQRAKLVVEFGVDKGGSTCALLLGLKNTGGFLLSVDIAPCEEAAAHVRNLGLEDLWRFTIADDVEWCRQNPGLHGTADLVFIDTIHLYDQTALELDCAEQLVGPRGIIVLHDTVQAPEFQDGVSRAIAGFREKHPEWRYFNYENDYGLGVLWRD